MGEGPWVGQHTHTSKLHSVFAPLESDLVCIYLTSVSTLTSQSFSPGMYLFDIHHHTHRSKLW
jgi:hypothetical protein